MELAGEEKQIRALFSELKFAEARRLPSFTSTWHRAQSRSLKPERAFNFSFVAATALLVCALLGLALWSRPWAQKSQLNVAVLSPRLTPSIISLVPKFGEVGNNAVHQNSNRSIRLGLRNAEQAKLAKAEITSAKAISNWQSPTDSLMRSPSEQVLTTVPQLNDAAAQLKSFLPDRNK